MIREALKKIRSSVAAGLKRLVRGLARRPVTRRGLNAAYRWAPYAFKRKLHSSFSKIYRDKGEPMERSDWIVRFAGKKVVIPITGDQSWLEWDAALSILGHETEILRTYESWIRDAGPQTVFFDVGANYGLHSLLFLVHGVRTVSFEPNRFCWEFFERLCARNSVRPDLQRVALGERQGQIELCYPENETWLGTVSPEAKSSLAGRAGLKTAVVEMTTLDSFVERTGVYPTLIKIDAEGYEINVLRGALNTIAKARPAVIFECFPGEGRAALWSFFEGARYEIFRLPARSSDGSGCLDREAFQRDATSNFLARPARLNSAGRGRDS